ncbi:uncharacterized protein FIBRA_05828 [Fibroporia radiculosa]|uniref:DNA mismatch repair protein MSH3 n=1 Tax=Fibroporia radiculosa TaxID=599839 RepID=J4H3R1_9APHY|nr:uncharacterized protein FIBRA_05828 [Fibroporia radiculosa]CCM03684.1 predicted protein [Fibroporia radiculosa]
MSSSSPKKQATISSFFSQDTISPSPINLKKRSSAHIDLTVDSDDDTTPVAKKQNTTSTFFSESRNRPNRCAEAGPSSGRLNLARVAKQWQFDRSLHTQTQTPCAPATEMRKNHERASKILLGRTDFFARNVPADGTVDISDEVEEGGNAEDVHETSSTDSDSPFREVIQTFTDKKGKTKKTSRNVAKKKAVEIGPRGFPYSPLELQVLDLKAKHPGTLLMVEVGYRMNFFGEDAEIVGKELGFVCFPSRNFSSAAMIPVHRQEVHLKKLLSKGYKVGIVEQTETAALKKVGDNRKVLFTRKLTHLYTAATYIEELDSPDDLEPATAPPLMCLVEELKGGMGADERVQIGMIVICPSTGDVVWDEFEDNHMRTELETRMVHSKPYELLLPEGRLSNPSEKLLVYFTEQPNPLTAEHQIRVERFKQDLTYTEAFSYLTDFYSDKSKSAFASDSYNTGKLMAAVTGFPKLVVAALAYTIKYLANFDIENCLVETNFFTKFAERTHMLLNGNTLTNLEIYRNETDYTTKGSLIWILDHTSTKFGARMLRSWVGRPLTNVKILKERISAVEEILADGTPKLTHLRELLRRLPDLAKGLCRIQYGKCTPQELAVLLPAFSKIAAAFQPINGLHDAPFKSKILNEIVAALPNLREPMNELMASISLKMAKEGKKEALWADPDKYPEIDSITVSIQIVESELMDELKNIRRRIKKPALMYGTWNGEEYLVEIRKDENREIPVTWFLVSSTKIMRRYHTPEVKKKLEHRARLKEALNMEANKAYLSFLQEISRKHYAVLRDAVNKLAVADCLMSLARVALQEGYVKPEITADDTLEIVEGRHPMIEVLRSDPFVPNSVYMGGAQPRSRIITGPNMGGKSSAVRMIALCAIMAQIGSYVPAQSMKIGLLDASDELARGRSTFMVEMQQTSDILQLATPRTLVILDELGRGTATFDGMAIASAVLQHLIEKTRCRTLFITHYPRLATDLERRFPLDVGNLHMGFAEDTRIDGTREVTFLYTLTHGLTEESFGVECGRLAGLPEQLLQVASERAQVLRAAITRRVRQNRFRKLTRLLSECINNSTGAARPVEELREYVAQI